MYLFPKTQEQVLEILGVISPNRIPVNRNEKGYCIIAACPSDYLFSEFLNDEENLDKMSHEIDNLIKNQVIAYYKDNPKRFADAILNNVPMSNQEIEIIKGIIE